MERAEREGDPGSGQISFPGGRREARDASLAATAERELQEEVGLSAVDLRGPLRHFGTFSANAFGLEVAAFAAALDPNARPPAAHDPNEVQGVFWLPYERLARTDRVPRRTLSGERPVESTVFERYVVWGFTRHLLLDLFAGLLPTA
jgi:8-oxo-dGTP pyrophosphatase MutT (NUDIX family)